MQIICMSGGGSRTKALAERLAYKLGYKSLCREQLIEEAIKEGIQFAKLETATIKPQIFTERLDLEREYYRAFTIAFIGRQMAETGTVYHGRSGHLLFSGIDHVLKVRIVEDDAVKREDVMQQLGLDSKKARNYIEQVEADRNKWARSMYGISLDDSSHYDVMLNLGHMSVENAASALASIAQLPDFQVTPASKKSLEDLVLAADARVLLARDKRTFRANVKVRADRGIVAVTYLPQDAGIEDVISEVLASLPGVRDISITMAMTNILWIEEAFDATSDAFQQVAEIATKWNAAVELFQFVPQDKEGRSEQLSIEDSTAYPVHSDFIQESMGGIEDEEETVPEDKGFQATKKALARLGRYGGGRQVIGDGEHILNSIDRTVPYSLMVMGNMFLKRGHSAQIRMSRQLLTYLSDKIKVPVVNVEDLKRQYLFSRHDLLNLIGCLSLFILILLTVFTYQEPILTFLTNEELTTKIIAVVATFLFVPSIAFLYGNVARSLMKLIRME